MAKAMGIQIFLRAVKLVQFRNCWESINIIWNECEWERTPICLK